MSKKQRRAIPRFQTPLIETHCHLDYLGDQDLASTLQRAADIGVEQIVTIAVSPQNLDTVCTLASSHPAVWGTQGIHPHDADSYNDAVEGKIVDNADNPRIVAIGEIGLDYYYDHADRAVQRRVFERQLALASELELPVVIHSRDADEDTRAILENAAAGLPRKGVIHSFTSGIDLAHWCLEAGFALGFNGITTFNKADNVRDVVAITPLTQLLLETDAPYLTPVPYRGKTNEPCYLPFIAEKIADVKQCAIEELLLQVYQNSVELFRLNTSGGYNKRTPKD